VPGDNQTYYAGAVSGGVWKTTDGAKMFELERLVLGPGDDLILQRL
jgi:hypothetical protein